MNRTEIEPLIGRLTKGLCNLMHTIATMNNEDARFPTLSNAFNGAYDSIKNPSYDIVVCGEMKKGKSSLLNAIIGQEILPVANQVATSQVFRITNSQKESFELVFCDGTRRNIAKDQLSYYGSQVDANLYGTHRQEFEGKVLDYIQVNIPIEFLPNGVSLIDTPGLGAVYKSHEFITQNYIRKAAAVLFVFDPERPLVELEKDFIKKVLGVTPHIMFVMTKIDMYTSEKWNTQLARTEDSLGTLFAEYRKTPPEVFPMSSKLLSDASQEDDADFKAENVKESMFPTIKDELMHIVLKAVCLTHNAKSLYESQAHIIKVREVVKGLLDAANSQGQQLDYRFREEKIQLQQRLESEWGGQSARNREIADEITAICNSVVINKVQQMFRPTGSIRAFYQSRIDNLTDMEQVEKLCHEMPRSLANDIASQWNSIMEDAKETVSGMLGKELSSVEEMSYEEIHNGSSGLDVKKLSLDVRIGNYRNQYFTGMFLTTIAVTVCPPLAPIVAVGAAIWGWLRGDSSNREQQLQLNKNNLSQKLALMLDEINRQLMDVLPGNTRSVVNEFVFQLKKASEKAISETVNNQKEQMRKQLTDMEQQAMKSIEEKKQEVQNLTNLMNSWQSLVPQTKELTELYSQIEQSLTV